MLSEHRATAFLLTTDALHTYKEQECTCLLAFSMKDQLPIPPAGARLDPRNKGWYLGWGVFRDEPSWHFAGFFGNQAKAEQKRASLGEQYQAVFGSHKLGTDDFIPGEQEIRG